MTAIAFFPWLNCTAPMSFGAVRLIPYERGRLPGSRIAVPQRTVDSLLGIYADRPDRRIRRAVLLEVGDWRSGDGVDADILSRLFFAKEALAFSAISKRRLFSGHNYCNAGNFQLIVQNFDSAHSEGVTISTRRRDGQTGNYWATRKIAFHIPMHINRTDIAFDEALVEVLMQQENEAWADAITEFNSANSDSHDTPAHLEMIMVKSAFERLLGIGQRVDDFSKALEHLLSPFLAIDTPRVPLRSKWLERRPEAQSLLDEWARDFCKIRGASAHGNNRAKMPNAWSQAAHLAFASILFPLVFKILAQNSGKYSLIDEDLTRISVLERYLAHDPFGAVESNIASEKHPWQVIDNEIALAIIARRLWSNLE